MMKFCLWKPVRQKKEVLLVLHFCKKSLSLKHNQNDRIKSLGWPFLAVFVTYQSCALSVTGHTLTDSLSHLPSLHGAFVSVPTTQVRSSLLFASTLFLLFTRSFAPLSLLQWSHTWGVGPSSAKLLRAYMGRGHSSDTMVPGHTGL